MWMLAGTPAVPTYIRKYIPVIKGSRQNTESSNFGFSLFVYFTYSSHPAGPGSDG